MGTHFAVLGGMFYVLYAADTTQAFLFHSLGVQPAMGCVLLAFHLYLSNKRVPAYLMALISLFIYETPFLLFLVAPLLKSLWKKDVLKEGIVHSMIVFLMLGVVFVFRRLMGEGRASALSLGDIAKTSILHMLQGPIVSLGTYLYRPIQAISSLNVEMSIVIILVFVVSTFGFYKLPVSIQIKFSDLWMAVTNANHYRNLPEEIKRLIQMMISGLAALILAYPITFTVRAHAISGRDTRVHFAGVFGSAMLMATIVILLIYLFSHNRYLKTLVIMITSLELALMAGYGFLIQQDYVNAWQYQRQFWTELVKLIPDVNEETVVLVDPEALRDTRQIGANYWNLPRVLYQLYQFPNNKRVPVVHRLEKGWQSSLIEDGKVQVNETTVYSVPAYFGEFDCKNVILIQSENGRLIRRTSISLSGKECLLKPISEPVLPILPHGILYDLMIGDEDFEMN